MKPFHYLAAMALTLALVLTSYSCSTNNNGGGGFTPFFGRVDMVVGDAAFPAVLLYFDILSFDPNSSTAAYPSPDVTLDNTTSDINEADSVILTADDLVVCDGDGIPMGPGGNDTVKVWRDYRSLSDNAAPDISFTNGGALGIDNPLQCAFDEVEDTLVVANADSNEVILIQDFANIADGVDPAATTVTLDMAGSSINTPTGLAVSGDDLYVANAANTIVGEPCVSIFRDISGLADADAPDVELDWDVTFFPDVMGGVPVCTQVAIGVDTSSGTATNMLFATTASGQVFIFNDADNLTDNDLADAILLPGPSELDVPIKPVMVNSRLFVPNFRLGNVGLPIGCDGLQGLSGFSAFNGFESGQFPDFSSGNTSSGNASTFGIAYAGDALFSVGYPDCFLGIIPGNVQVYRDAVNLFGETEPTFVIPGNGTGSSTTDLSFPISIDAREVNI